MKTKRLALYSMLVVASLAFSYFETFIPTSALLPGFKLGLANLIILLLLSHDDIKGAFAVNATRIALASLLFGTPLSFLFSLLGGTLSTAIMFFAKRIKDVSYFGIGVLGGVAHNIGQLIMAVITFKTFSVLTLTPWLTLLGALCGTATGFIALLLTKNKHINKLFIK